MAGGPLGKYSQSVAALIAVVVIGAAIAMRFLRLSDPFVDNMALIALGAVFGAAASTAVNGSALEAAHRRLDLLDHGVGIGETEVIADAEIRNEHK